MTSVNKMILLYCNICCLTEEMFTAMNKHLINLDNGGYNIGYDGTFSIQRQE